MAWISLPSMGMAGEDDFELVAASLRADAGVGMAGEDDFELVAASLRADAGDLGVFVEALAVKLEQALQNGHYVSPRLSPPAAPLGGKLWFLALGRSSLAVLAPASDRLPSPPRLDNLRRKPRAPR